MENFRIDVSTMIPKESDRMHKFNNIMFYWWKLCWMFLTPLLLTALTIFSWIDASRIESGGYLFPVWTEVIGNMLSASSLLGIFGWMIYAFVNARYFTKKPLKTLIQRDKAWRPLLEKNYRKVLEAYDSQHIPIEKELIADA